MEDNHITAVQQSFAQVVPIKDTAAELFYGRLFEIAPDVQPLFKGDMSDQGSKLMATLGAVVNGLRDLPAIVPVAEELARKHVAYGVEPGHYEHVGAALLDTLEKGLGDGFTDDVRDAWVAAYTTLSGVIIAAAYPEESSA